MVLKECELLARLYTFRDNPHVQILTHANHCADYACIVSIRSDRAHECPVDLQRVYRKALQMIQARIAGTEVIESEVKPQLFEVPKYCQRGLRILHKEGFCQLKFQKT